MFLAKLSLLLLGVFSSAVITEPVDVHFAVQHCLLERTVPRSKPRSELPRILFTSLSHSTINSIIDEEDVRLINELSSCVREVSPPNFSERKFDQGTSGYGGGNNVTYLGFYFTSLLPELISHIINVAQYSAEISGWRPHPRHLGVRCVEHLSYGEGGELLMHQDTNSIITITIMLSDPDSFVGGDFVIETKKTQNAEVRYDGYVENSQDFQNQYRIRTPRFGGMIFDSNAEHSVSPISKGVREVMAIELWAYGDTGPYDLRPEHGAPFPSKIGLYYEQPHKT